MRRRTVLRRTAALGAITGLAGCTSSDPSDTPTPTPGNGNGGGPTPTPSGVTGFGDVTVETTDAGCDGGEAGTADVAFDANALRVTVDGVLETSDPCHRARFESVNYDPVTGRLTLTVSARPAESDGVCAQCIGAVHYTATVPVEGALPGSVRVRHQQGEETTEITTVARS